ncbi:MAG: hydantoinase B/oxoprolinase family protein [Candidatus Puniceispirillales bacterium]|jgi:5-oxoprolinase (ATP-hydrolysing)|nr:hydantoinase B/oxoprolinase family protein [Alphaproteobacteria bacterium]MBL6850372.1 hydantoinase B/oxoprolinase family protein [Alphaproteobacteria bacterium]
MWQFWIDRGGTFTDIVAKNPDGNIVVDKLLSENTSAYKDAAIAGIKRILGLNNCDTIPTNKISCVKMGTTVATNALLERKGDRTLLLITDGFGDLLKIGYQNRPLLFDLDIKLPELLYEKVVEIPERLDSQGKVIKNLDIKKARQALREAKSEGIDSVAIAFMHSYVNPEHENIIAKIAEEENFNQISVSHRVSPLIKLVGRGDTTVVDAYLSPILRRYVNQISEELKGTETTKLMFMQSNGGLTDANFFQGKDALLSGPAGGVVSMTETGKQAGYNKLIGFDMGGTSTDVCHFAGEYERSFETELAGVRIRAPMMEINTVAAGGGSILSFKDGRFQVGPESAGAIPGPASYGKGGPLTVTDCNVLLGKLHPNHFPKVFGENGDEPLNTAIVKKKFLDLSKLISEQNNQPIMDIYKVAEGFLKIAIENMANAIKKISIQKGYDITGYTMNCFGGAGGQHACQVADSLGISRVLIHPYAGVLSAYGMGLAEIRSIRESHFEKNIKNINDAKKLIDLLSLQAREDLNKQGVSNSSISLSKNAFLHYQGSHQNLEVKFDTISKMIKSFEKEHKKRFGFFVEGREIFIEMLTVEAISNNFETQDFSRISGPTEISKPVSYQNMFVDDLETSVPIYERDKLKINQTIVGPAIISEATGTNIIEKGWSGSLDKYYNLILSRVEEKKKDFSVGTSVDSVMLEVFNNLFMNIAEQMGATLANTAFSVNIKERLDFSCALFDEEGSLVANAPHVPVHLGSMSEAIRTVIKLNKDNIFPGDVFVLNAPFNGGTHLPDVTVITPVFDKYNKRIIFFVASRGHHADIGGKTPGSGPPDSKHIEEEGVLIDNFKIFDKGVFKETEIREILSSGKYPCRNIEHNMADLAAQIAANKTGINEINSMIDQFGIETVHAYMKHVQNNAEECIRNAIVKLNDGKYEYELDNGEFIKVKIKIDKIKRQALIDFTGTAKKNPLNYNAPLAVCHAVILYVFRTLVGNNIPLNEGCFKPIKIKVPNDSMINAKYPSAVIAGNTEVSQLTCNALFGALGVIAGSQATMNNFIWGNDRIQNYETICGGTGAGPNFHGTSAVQTHMTNTRSTDPEVLETRFPVRLEEFSIRKNSGGKGKYCGGDGVIRKLRFLEPMTVTTLCSHRKIRPFGVNGGEPGECGREWLEKENGRIINLNGNDSCEVEMNDLFVMLTPGGGGFGKK